MKKQITRTVEETITLCDHCGKEVIYSEQACVVCGKVACHECFHSKLVEIKIDQIPDFCPPNRGVETFHAYSCPGCSNKITRRFSSVKRLTEIRNSKCKKWWNWHREQIAILNRWKDEAEK